MTKQTDTDTSAEAVEAHIQGQIKEGILSEGLPRTQEDTEADYKTVDLIRALAAERDKWKARAERAEAERDVMKQSLTKIATGNFYKDHMLKLSADECLCIARAALAQTDAEPAEPVTPADAQSAQKARDKRIREEALREAADAIRLGTRNTVYQKSRNDAVKTILALIEKDKTDE